MTSHISLLLSVDVHEKKLGNLMLKTINLKLMTLIEDQAFMDAIPQCF